MRKRLAQEQVVPPYVVFHDRTLVAMAVRRPRTPDELLQVDGVGEKKLERYGEVFLSALTSEPESG